MIQIIKNQPANYIMKSQHRDGKFQYNLEDVREDYYYALVVTCPCCGNWELHKNRLKSEVTD